MIKVVIDTNVFVSSFFGGLPRQIIDLWRSGQVTLCLSAAIADEYIDVLQRLGLKNTRELEELLTLLARGQNILFTTKTPSLNLVKSDPDDDKFIECAVALKAAYVITGDRALKAVKKYMKIKIVSPREFLQSLKPVA